MIDGISKISQLCSSTSIIEDEVLTQTRVSLAHIEVLIGNAIDGLFASHFHSWPVAVQVIGIAPHIECQGIPAGLVVYEYSITVMFHRAGFSKFLNAISGNTQIDVTVDGKVEVGQLYAIATIIEDEVLNQTCVGLAHIEILPCNTVVVPCACDIHARPVTVQVVDIAPHI